MRDDPGLLKNGMQFTVTARKNYLSLILINLLAIRHKIIYAGLVSMP